MSIAVVIVVTIGMTLQVTVDRSRVPGEPIEVGRTPFPSVVVFEQVEDAEGRGRR